jgi:Ca2+-binding EF-hand superfamily protein
MASYFQRRKVGGVFGAMDTDGDGYLTERDFRALAGRWAAVREGGDRTRLTKIMMGWWGTLRDAAGTDRVAIEDVLAVVDRLAELPGPVAATAEAMFEAVDENGDGRVTPGEYRRMVEAWTGRATETDEVFGLLDLDRDGLLSRAEFVGHWTEFWAGDDPGAPGSWVFGRFPMAGQISD